MNNKKIAIIGAMDCEVNKLRGMLQNPEVVKKGNLSFYLGSINNHSVIIAQSGVGKVNAAVCTQVLIDTFQPDYVINTGIAGGLASDLSVGDIVAGSQLVQYDFDTSALGYAKGYMCTGVNKDKPTVFYSDEQLISEFEEAVLKSGFKSKVHKGIIATGDTFVSDGKKKQEIKEIFNASAVEMEGCAIAQCAQINSVPCLIVRAISDLANGEAAKSLDVFEKEMAEVSAQTIKILLDKIS